MSRVLSAVDAGVATITLARPEKKNALDEAMARELRDALRNAGERSDVRVVVLRGEGPDFCAGADLEALERLLDAGTAAHERDARALADLFLEMRRLGQPVVAAVRGRALAGGAGLATAGDLVIAHEHARFGYPEIRVGFVPAMVMTMLRRSVGEKRAFELVSTGRVVDAREALELGLVSRVIPDAEFETAVAAAARSLADAPPTALRLTKQLFVDLDGVPFEEALARGVATNVAARATDEFRDGVRRFTHRERPQS